MADRGSTVVAGKDIADRTQAVVVRRSTVVGQVRGSHAIDLHWCHRYGLTQHLLAAGVSERDVERACNSCCGHYRILRSGYKRIASCITDPD